MKKLAKKDLNDIYIKILVNKKISIRTLID